MTKKEKQKQESALKRLTAIGEALMTWEPTNSMAKYCLDKAIDHIVSAEEFLGRGIDYEAGVISDDDGPFAEVVKPQGDTTNVGIKGNVTSE